MADGNKTLPTDVDVHAFLATVESERRRRDAYRLLDMMEHVTGEQPVMWGPSIVGFGTYHYQYDSGRSGDGPAAAFSPRKAATTVYLDGMDPHAADLAVLGPHTVSKACLYLKDLDKVDLEVLERIITRAWRTVTAEGYAS